MSKKKQYNQEYFFFYFFYDDDDDYEWNKNKIQKLITFTFEKNLKYTYNNVYVCRKKLPRNTSN